jgi:hypothetical protein
MPTGRTTQLYLDCDGVLADFDAGAAALFGMSPHAFQQKRGLAAFWKVLARHPDFFGSLPLMPDARILFDAVRHLDPIILTGLPHGAWAEPQKRRWAERHFPGVPVITTRAALKREYCHPGDALVDDNDKFRRLWEAAGGVFIHHRSAGSSIEALVRHGFLPASSTDSTRTRRRGGVAAAPTLARGLPPTMRSAADRHRPANG